MATEEQLVEKLVAAVRHFVDYYQGKKVQWLGNGQALDSYDEFRSLLARIDEAKRKEEQNAK